MHSESTTFKAPRRSARVPPAYRPSAAYYAPVYTGPSRREICILTFACIAIMLATVIFMMVVFTRAGVLYVPEGSLLGSYRVFQTFPPPPLRALRHAPKVTEYIEMDPAKRTLPPIPGPPRNYSTPSGSAWDALPRIAIVTLNHQAPQKRVVRLNQQPASRQTYPRESANVWMHPMSYANKVAYCKKWGYDLIIEDSSLVDPQRDPAWGKIPILRKWLPKYQWIMWVDMDAFFMRFDLPATDLISDAHDMVIAKDWHGINFGIFLMRNSEWSLRLLDLMWYTPPRWWKPWEEQSAFTSLLNPLKTGVVAAAELERRVLIRGQREMNSYGAEFAYGNQAAQYRDGDRMVHFPNCKAIHSCRSTIVKFYRLMCARNGLPTSLPQPNETPAKVLPLNRSSSGASHG